MSSLVLHDYVTQPGGAERVAALLAKDFGEGMLTTSAYAPAHSHTAFAGLDVRELAPWTPDFAKVNRALLAPIAASAFAKYRPEAESIICSSSGWSHWIQTESPTLVYCYTPPRWLWVADDYFAGIPPMQRKVVTQLMRPLRRVDVSKARSRTRYVAISSVVRERIHAVYGINAEIVFPPVTLDPAGPQQPVESLEPGFFLLIARPRGYKNADGIVELFESTNIGTLVLVGGKKMPGQSGRVRHLGRVSEENLRWLYQNSGGVLALSHEDFGLTPVEGHLFGKPTIALRAGGYLDTCREGENAIFVESTEPNDVKHAIETFRQMSFSANDIRSTTTPFLESTFRQELCAILEDIRQ